MILYAWPAIIIQVSYHKPRHLLFLTLFYFLKVFTLIQNDETISFFEMATTSTSNVVEKPKKTSWESQPQVPISRDFHQIFWGWAEDSAMAAFFGVPVLGLDGITRFHLAGRELDLEICRFLVLRILFKIVYNYFEYKHIYQTKWYGYVSIQKQDIVVDALEFTISYKNYLKVLSSFCMLINLPLEMERHQHHFFMEQELLSPGPAMWQPQHLFAAWVIIPWGVKKSWLLPWDLSYHGIL